MTIYIVSGIIRSGTSMMMAALEAGGLEVVRLPERQTDQYNPSGIYQLPQKELNTPDFPAHLDGKLIKVLHRQLSKVGPTDGISIVFMRRGAEESEQSARAFLRMPPPTTFEAENIIFDKIIAEFIARPDVISADIFQYADVINSPLMHFEILKTHGWPIDTELCAKIPKVQYRHFGGDNGK
jgi:hypothetical protein